LKSQIRASVSVFRLDRIFLVNFFSNILWKAELTDSDIDRWWYWRSHDCVSFKNWYNIYFQAGCPFALSVTFFFGYNRGIAPAAAIKEAFSLDKNAASPLNKSTEE
jgi:hypothetical protein